MTLWSGRDGDENVMVSVTYGPVQVQVIEHMSHARSFWHQLGALLNEMEHPAPAVTDVAVQLLPGDESGGM